MSLHLQEPPNTIQNKAPVEFDQAINYVNKIKVRAAMASYIHAAVALCCQCLSSCLFDASDSKPVSAVIAYASSGSEHGGVHGGCFM
jgi:hypothetical protein